MASALSDSYHNCDNAYACSLCFFPHAYVQWQNSRIKQYCSQHKLKHKNYSQLNAGLLQHLIFDDVHKVVYCYVPKAGCTMMTTAFVLLQKLFTLHALEKKGTLVSHRKYLSKVKTFRNRPVTEIEHKLETYYKFMIVRNPLERLYSAFNEKLTRLGVASNYRAMSKAVLKYSHDHTSQFPNFEQFARAFVETNMISRDVHFIQMVQLCDPCSMQYDFYLNFANMSHDVSQMFQLLDIPQEYYFNKIKHSTALMPHPHSSTINNNPNQLSASHAYNQLKPDIMNDLNNKCLKDIEFFRMLYPELIE